MNKILFILSLLPFAAAAQSFAPEYGQPGSTAIPKDSSCFIAWATNGTISRGYIDINDTTMEFDDSNRATFGSIENAFGPAEGDITSAVSLGDSGIVTLTFDQLITDGPGFDFAIFENGFVDHYMELGHVEVSSDGVHFFRFPSTSEIPTDVQLSNSSTSDCRYVNNLAGKYKRGFGTPFDLADLPVDALLNTEMITHIRIIDAIGAITGTGTTDQNDTVINDPYPTPFSSCGFDLDAVGVINVFLNVEENELAVQLYPNPASDHFSLALPGTATVSVMNAMGQLVSTYEHTDNSTFSFSQELDKGVYFVVAENASGKAVRQLIRLL